MPWELDEEGGLKFVFGRMYSLELSVDPYAYQF